MVKRGCCQNNERPRDIAKRYHVTVNALLELNWPGAPRRGASHVNVTSRMQQGVELTMPAGAYL